MKRFGLFAAVIMLSGVGTLWTVQAQGDKEEKKKPNAQEPPKNLKVDDKTKALQDLALAAKLIAFGREQKSPESLLLAAKIIHNPPTAKLKAEKNEVTGKATEPAASPKENGPKPLIAEAKAMSSAPHIKALAAATEQVIAEEPRGRVGGPAQLIQTVGPGQTWTVTATFVGGRQAEVDIDLSGVFGRCVMTVHDQFGNLIARDAIPGNFYNCRWVPLFTGQFTIRLANIDSIPLRCDLLTN
jgi:hypothetical protein